MVPIQLDKLSSLVANKTKPFIEEILGIYPENVHSIHIIGSCITEDCKCNPQPMKIKRNTHLFRF